MNGSRSPKKILGVIMAIIFLAGCTTPITTSTLPHTSSPPTIETYDVREAWYGNYLGITEGMVYDENGTWPFEDYDLWFQIKRWQDCGSEDETFSVCPENISWGVFIANIKHGSVDYVYVRFYLPADLIDAPRLTITENALTLIPTEDFPYEIVIERGNGQLEGYMVLDWGNPIQIPDFPPERWVIEDFIADPYEESIPPHCEPWPDCQGNASP